MQSELAYGYLVLGVVKTLIFVYSKRKTCRRVLGVSSVRRELGFKYWDSIQSAQFRPNERRRKSRLN